MSDYADFLRQKIKLANFKGFPSEWAQCMPTATPSTRGRRQPRSWK